MSKYMRINLYIYMKNQSVMNSTQRKSQYVSRGTTSGIQSPEMSPKTSTSPKAVSSFRQKKKRVQILSKNDEYKKGSEVKMMSNFSQSLSTDPGRSPNQVDSMKQRDGQINKGVIAPLQRRAITVQQTLQIEKEFMKERIEQYPQQIQVNSQPELKFTEHLNRPYQIKTNIPQVRRVFLKSKVHSDHELNFSDGIIIPHTLFTILTDKQYHSILKIHKQKEPLLVVLSDTRTFFNINMNILHRQHLQSGNNHEASFDKMEKNGKSLISYHNQQVIGHIHQIIDTSQNVENLIPKNSNDKPVQQEDHDTIMVPRWMLERLKVKEGDPLCLIFDLNFSRIISGHKNGSASPFAKAQSITMNFISSQKAGKYKKIRKQRSLQNSLKKIILADSAEMYKEEIREILRNYKLLRIDEEVSIQVRDKMFLFKVQAVNDQTHQLVFFNDNCKSLEIKISNTESMVQQNILQMKQQSPLKTMLSLKHQDPAFNETLEKKLKAEEEEVQKQLRDLDLNEIIRQRGLLDLDLIEKVLEAKKKEAQAIQRRNIQQQMSFRRQQTIQPQRSSFFNKKKALIDGRRRTENPQVLGKAMKKILVQDQTQKSQSSDRFEKVDEIQMSEEASRNEDEIDNMLLDQGKKVQEAVRTMTSDSNFQHYTMEKGEIILRGQEQAAPPQRVKKLSQSSKTLEAIKQIKHDQIPKSQRENSKINVFDQAPKSSRLNQNKGSQSNLKMDGTTDLNGMPNSLVINDQLQNMSIELRNKKSGTIQRASASKRRGSNKQQKDEACDQKNQSQKYLTEDMRSQKGQQNIKEKRKNIEIKSSSRMIIGGEKIRRDSGIQKQNHLVPPSVHFSEFGETARFQSESGFYNSMQGQLVVGNQIFQELNKKDSTSPFNNQRNKESTSPLNEFLELEDQMLIHGEKNQPIFKGPKTTIYGSIQGDPIRPSALPGYVQNSSKLGAKRPGTTYAETRGKIHQTQKFMNEMQHKTQALFIQQFDQMANEKKGKGYVPPQPGQLSAMFNKFNDQIDKERAKSYAQKIQSKDFMQQKNDEMNSDQEEALSKRSVDENIVNFVQSKPLYMRRSVSPTNREEEIQMIQNEYNSRKYQQILQFQQEQMHDDTSTLMHQGESRPNLRINSSINHGFNASQLGGTTYNVNSYIKAQEFYQHGRSSNPQKKAIKIPQSNQQMINQSNLKPWGKLQRNSAGGPNSSAHALNSDISRLDNKDYESMYFNSSGIVGGQRTMIPVPKITTEISKIKNQKTPGHKRTPGQSDPNLIQNEDADFLRDDLQSIHDIEEQQRDCFKMHNVSVYENSSQKKKHSRGNSAVKSAIGERTISRGEDGVGGLDLLDSKQTDERPFSGKPGINRVFDNNTGSDTRDQGQLMGINSEDFKYWFNSKNEITSQNVTSGDLHLRDINRGGGSRYRYHQLMSGDAQQILEIPQSHPNLVPNQKIFGSKRAFAKGKNWKLMQTRQVSPSSLVHPVKIELDNDYYSQAQRQQTLQSTKESLFKPSRRMVSTPLENQIIPAQEMLHKREKGLRTLCNTQSLFSNEIPSRKSRPQTQGNTSVQYQSNYTYRGIVPSPQLYPQRAVGTASISRRFNIKLSTIGGSDQQVSQFQ